MGGVQNDEKHMFSGYPWWLIAANFIRTIKMTTELYESIFAQCDFYAAIFRVGGMRRSSIHG